MEYARGHQPRQSPPFVDEAIERLRDAGFKLTPQRNAILALFDKRRTDHLTPQAIFEALGTKMSSLSLATVYNSLEVFEEVGIVDKILGENGQSYFDPNTTPHHHAVCRGCDKIFDLDVPQAQVDALLAATSPSAGQDGGFEVEGATIWFRGVCSDCP